MPVLHYGDEIGLRDDLSLPGRLATRPPMRWSPGDGGFSTAPPKAWVRPAAPAGGGVKDSVAEQRADPDSVLSFTRHVMSLRRDCQEIGHGASRVLESPDPGVLLVESTWLDGVVVTAHNLSDRRVERALGDDLPEEPLDDVVDLTSSRLVDLREPMSLDPFGVRWLRIREPGQISRSSAGDASAAP